VRRTSSEKKHSYLLMISYLKQEPISNNANVRQRKEAKKRTRKQQEAASNASHQAEPKIGT